MSIVPPAQNDGTERRRLGRLSPSYIGIGVRVVVVGDVPAVNGD